MVGKTSKVTLILIQDAHRQVISPGLLVDQLHSGESSAALSPLRKLNHTSGLNFDFFLHIEKQFLFFKCENTLKKASSAAAAGLV